MSTAEHIAFVAPRFAEGPTVGGAETLLRRLALRVVAAGRRATFLTTCARNHFTWENEIPPGRKTDGGLEVVFFPVNPDRNIPEFLRVQDAISRGASVSESDERLWLGNNVNSDALCRHLLSEGERYDRIVVGPYLFGLTCSAAQIHPSRTLLLPCLHDEPFAYLPSIKAMFRSVRGLLFNTDPERSLARRIYGLGENAGAVVGMGMDPFEADSNAFRRRHPELSSYVIYSGRRETLKGTPLLLDYVDAFRSRTGEDVKLVLTGTGEIHPPPTLAPHVLDLGFVDEEEKHDAMAGAVAFCHPSVNESLSIVLLEAWMARTPALVHGKGDVLPHQCRMSRGGLWFRTYPEFEEELALLRHDAGLRRAMGQAGRDYVLKEYAWEVVDRRLFAALEAPSGAGL